MGQSSVLHQRLVHSHKHINRDLKKKANHEGGGNENVEKEKI